MLLVIPLLAIAELVVIVQVAHLIGWLDTIALLVLVSIVGGWLVKRSGLGVLRRVQRQLEAGQPPHRELLDGVMVLAAGVLLFVPGFITAAVGLALLVPPVRAGIRSFVARRMERRLGTGYTFARRTFMWFGGGGSVIDTEGRDASAGPTSHPRRPRAEIDTHAVGGRHGRR